MFGIWASSLAFRLLARLPAAASATRPQRIATGADYPAQYVPTFVPRRAENAKSRPFEAPNSVLSYSTALRMDGLRDLL